MSIRHATASVHIHFRWDRFEPWLKIFKTRSNRWKRGSEHHRFLWQPSTFVDSIHKVRFIDDAAEFARKRRTAKVG